ncbi:MAG: alpha/beta hydrolase [Sedimentibacter sp.]|uniref:alpha/beta hydrolase n=1 Tax=Sedimentibacter sp. TaxID=1960295 RepID=UPI002980E03B|nr:alpha/beta hydrolase [Sedimentibacter sp.]MDW5299764.1 alpha/beta hydrolase [Sedimentibacter sp.]
MAINKVVRVALKTLSYKDIDVKKNYIFHRNFVNLTHRHYLKPFFKSMDCQVDSENHSIPVRIFSPEDEGDYPILLFLHGGGWVTGNIDSYSKVCANMAKLTNHNVVSVDYRLAPENPFPAGLEDCYQVAKAFITNNEINDKHVTLIGDSAGGNLAAALSLLARDRKEFHIDKQILLYPATYNNHSDTSPFQSVHDNGTNYLLTSKRICDYMDLYKSKNEDLLNPYFAPLLEEDLTNQPNTLIITAEFCPLRDEGEKYGKKLREAGNKVEIYRVKDAFHGFFALPPRFPQVKLCYEIINHFLCEVN